MFICFCVARKKSVLKYVSQSLSRYTKKLFSYNIPERCKLRISLSGLVRQIAFGKRTDISIEWWIIGSSVQLDWNIENSQTMFFNDSFFCLI